LKTRHSVHFDGHYFSGGPVLAVNHNVSILVFVGAKGDGGGGGNWSYK